MQEYVVKVGNRYVVTSDVDGLLLTEHLEAAIRRDAMDAVRSKASL